MEACQPSEEVNAQSPEKITSSVVQETPERNVAESTLQTEAKPSETKVVEEAIKSTESQPQVQHIASPQAPAKSSAHGHRTKPVVHHNHHHNQQPQVNHEVEWFRFENKIRFIIDSLMVPLHQSAKETREGNEQMKTTVTKLEAQVNDFTFQMKLFEQKLRMFEELHRRILHVEDKVIMYETRGDNLGKSFQNLTLQNNSFIQTTTDKLKNFESQLDRHSLYQYMQTNLDKFRENIFRENVENENKREKLVAEVIAKVHALDEKYGPTFAKAREMTLAIETKFAIMGTHELQLERLQEKIKKLKTKTWDELKLLKKNENQDEMELAERMTQMHATFKNTVSQLRTEVALCFTKKETEQILKEQIATLKIKIKGLEPQEMSKTIQLPEAQERKQSTKRVTSPQKDQQKGKETLNSSRKRQKHHHTPLSEDSRYQQNSSRSRQKRKESHKKKHPIEDQFQQDSTYGVVRKETNKLYPTRYERGNSKVSKKQSKRFDKNPITNEQNNEEAAVSPNRRGTKRIHVNENILQIPGIEQVYEEQKGEQVARTVKKKVNIEPLDFNQMVVEQEYAQKQQMASGIRSDYMHVC